MTTVRFKPMLKFFVGHKAVVGSAQWSISLVRGGRQIRPTNRSAIRRSGQRRYLQPVSVAM